MVWVGGSIIVHGLEAYDVHLVGHVIGSVAEATAHALPSVAGAVQWIVETFLSGVIGLLIGGISIPGNWIGHCSRKQVFEAHLVQT